MLHRKIGNFHSNLQHSGNLTGLPIYQFTQCGIVYDSITMPLLGSFSHSSSFMPVMREPGASSCTSCDSSTGMTATSTGSTRSRVRERAKHRSPAE